MPEPHLLHVLVDDQWSGYDLECPYGNEIDRPCLCTYEDGTTEDGCGAATWLNETPDQWEYVIKMPRRRVAGPIPVFVTWDHSDECFKVEAAPELIDGSTDG